MFITGPDVIKTVTGEEVTMEELGGAHTHMSKSGTASYVGSDEEDALDYVRELLSYLPSNNRSEPPRTAAPQPVASIEDSLNEEDLELDSLIPDSPNQPYDMHEVIRRILDDDEFLEVQAEYATNIIVGFGRVDGRSVGDIGHVGGRRVARIRGRHIARIRGRRVAHIRGRRVAHVGHVCDVVGAAVRLRRRRLAPARGDRREEKKSEAEVAHGGHRFARHVPR